MFSQWIRTGSINLDFPHPCHRDFDIHSHLNRYGSQIDKSAHVDQITNIVISTEVWVREVCVFIAPKDLNLCNFFFTIFYMCYDTPGE